MTPIRMLTSDDAAAYQRLRLRGLQEHPEAFASSHDEEAPTPLHEVALRLQPRDDRAIFGAFADQRLVALTAIQREGLVKLSHKAFIWGVYVAPEARGQGIGAGLLGQALEQAVANLRVRQVHLGVNTQNIAAIALYRRFGFKEYGLERNFLVVNGEAHDSFQMAWQAAGAA